MELVLNSNCIFCTIKIRSNQIIVYIICVSYIPSIVWSEWINWTWVWTCTCNNIHNKIKHIILRQWDKVYNHVDYPSSDLDVCIWLVYENKNGNKYMLK